MNQQSMQVCSTQSNEAPLAKVRAPETPADRYSRDIMALAEHAVKNNEVRTFAHVLTESLASMAVVYGLSPAGDILESLGKSMKTFAEIERAKLEAEKARKKGLVPH